MLLHPTEAISSSGWTSPDPSSLSSQGTHSRPLTILVAPHWTCYGLSISFLYWKAQNWMQYCSLGLMKADNFPLSTDYAPVNITQDAVSLPCCQGTRLTHIQLAICQEPQVPFSSAAIQPVTPQPLSARGYTFPSAALAICPCRILQSSCRSITPVCLGPSGWQPCPQRYQLFTPPWTDSISCQLQIWWVCTHSTFQIIDKVLMRQIPG